MCVDLRMSCRAYQSYLNKLPPIIKGALYIAPYMQLTVNVI